MGNSREHGTHTGSSSWTGEQVRLVLEGTCRALMCSQLTTADLPSELRACWPLDILRSKWEDTPTNGAPVLRPDALQIAEAVQATHWLLWINPPRDRKVVTGRLFGAKWRSLERFDGRSREWLQRGIYPRAFDEVAHLLNLEQKTSFEDFTNITNFAM